MDKIIFGKKEDRVEYDNRPGVYVIIFDDKKEKIAIIQTSNGYFLPGGGIDNNESHEECLKREAIEELGWKIEIGKYLGDAGQYFYSPVEKKYIFSDAHFYLGGKTEDACEPTAFDHKTVWLTIDEAKQKLYHEHQVWALEQI